jgi:uncharacterized protein (TIGR02266 family)
MCAISEENVQACSVQSLQPMHTTPTVTTAAARKQPPPLPSREERYSPRVEIATEIGIDDHTNFYVGFGENVCDGGLFVATYNLRPVGTPVALTFVLDERSISLTGVVRWIRDPRNSDSEVPPGMGIRFSHVSDEDRSAIETYVRARAPMFQPD